jgi:hypothetical protein
VHRDVEYTGMLCILGLLLLGHDIPIDVIVFMFGKGATTVHATTFGPKPCYPSNI